MKKVLIVIDNLNTGGVATSFYNFLSEMCTEAEFDILVFNENSIDADKIPSNVNIINTQKILHILGKTHKEITLESKYLSFIQLILKVISRMINGFWARKLLMPFIKDVGDYDVAIAYSQDDAWKNLSKGCIDFVLYKCNAKLKSTIIHCDYKRFGGYDLKQVRQYDGLNRIICVSESCKESFIECFPSLSNKTVVCENFINVEDIVIRSMSNPVAYSPNTVNFVTVCRISKEKGLCRTVNAFSDIEKKGFKNYKWMIVGDGPEKKELEKIIKDRGLSNRIVLAGNKKNPYPYIKNATFFLLTSENEAAPMVFGESAVLGVPIITTKTCSAVELVEKRNLGWVVENSQTGIETGIENALLGKYNEFKAINIENLNDIPHKQFSKLFKDTQ